MENNTTNGYYKIKSGTERDKYIRDLIFESTKFLSQDEAWQRIIKKSKSLWAFFRATNVIFWDDLSNNPLFVEYGDVEKSRFWICGDAHFQNIAVQERGDSYIYSFNDFDDAVIADYQYDLFRMLVAMSIKDPENASEYHELFLKSYFDCIKNISSAEETNLDTNIFSNELADWMEKQRRFIKQKKWIKKLTDKKNGKIRFKLKKKMLWLKKKEQSVVKEALKDLVLLSGGNLKDDFFEVQAVSKRVEGLGSFLRERFYVLVNGANDNEDTDLKKLKVLDVKFQSVPSPFVKNKQIREMTMQTAENHGKRVVVAQKAINPTEMQVLAYVKIKGSYFSLREVLPLDKKYPFNFKNTENTHKIIADWGKAIALAHVRSARSLDKDFVGFINEKFSNLSDLDIYVVKCTNMASLYAKQLQSDYKQWHGLSENLENLIDDFYSQKKQNEER